MKPILIVEDNEKNLRLARDLLQSCGYDTIEATTAEDGIALAKEALPALILMDIQLPGMNGIEALKCLKADASTKDIPVIAVTASVMSHDEKEIMAAGFDSYQRKPLDLDDFLNDIKKFLPNTGCSWAE